MLAMSVSLFGTWVDMPVNALTIRILPQTQHMQAGAIRSTATCLGAIVGGGLMLILYNHMGWASPFYAAGLNTPPPKATTCRCHGQAPGNGWSGLRCPGTASGPYY
ncbi:hypothetical protein ACFS4T_16680 [Pseudomonas lini]